MGQGLQRILRTYGRTNVGDTMWIWDYANEKPMSEKDMTEDMQKASDKAHSALLKKQMDEDRQ